MVAFDELWKSLNLGETAGVGIARTIKAPAVAARRPGDTLALADLPRLSIEEDARRSTVSADDPMFAGARAAGETPCGGRAGGVDLRISGVLGEGGMGRVLLARQHALRRDVAVKMVRPETTTHTALDGLLAEAVIQGSLEHPSVVPVHALGRDDKGRPVLVMKRIEGVAWQELLSDASHPRWSEQGTVGDDRLAANLEILMAVSNAVHFAHSRGVVHRDIKPDNVMIGGFGEVYLVDWGIATSMDVSARGEDDKIAPLVGTPGFLAPEMLNPELGAIDARTDVYLLGATLHVVLTGEMRHPGSSLFEVLASAVASRPAVFPPSIPHELAALCNQACSTKKEDRPPTAAAFRRALAEYVHRRGSLALAAEASDRLAELGAAPDLPLPERYRLMTECRFGFVQALREWKDNAAARAGLAACLEAMIDTELSQRNAEGARALLAELGDGRPDLVARLAALDAELAARHEREERLRAYERDRDVSIGARSRLVAYGAFAVANVALVAMVMTSGEKTFTLTKLVAWQAALFLMAAVGAIVGRDQIMRTAYGRTSTALTLVGFGALLCNGVVGAMVGHSVEAVVTTDLWISTFAAAMSAITIVRGWWLGTVLFAIGTIYAEVHPDHAVRTGCAFALVYAALVTFFTHRMTKPSAIK